MVKKRKKTVKIQAKKNNLFKIVGAVFAVVLVLFLAYSAYSFKQSSQEEEGFFTCSPDGTVCELSQHIHANIIMSVCNKSVVFPKETGNLKKVHTHKDANKLHWHEVLRVDPVSRIPIDNSPLSIASFLEQMNYTFPQECASNATPSLSVMVNGAKTDEQLRFTWNNGDVIHIVYQ